MPAFDDSISRSLNKKLGEIPSLLDFGAVGDGVADDTAAVQSALDSVVTAGVLRTVHAPAGTYLITAAIVVPAGVTLAGDGAGTVFKRGGDIVDGSGIFDISGVENVFLSDFVIDGDVTTPTGTLYASFGGDPMDTSLTKNTSVWVKSGSRNVRIRGVRITHTGGYSILLDAASSEIQDVTISGCQFVHNRPHLFGTVEGQELFGSWTGGVFYRGAGIARVRNLIVSACTFRKCTGNCLWGHSPELQYHHENFSFTGNVFEDIGLDGILMGDVYGGVVSGNSFHRVGYIHSADGENPHPAQLLIAPPTALDSSGYVRGVNYIGNSFVSINGGSIDLDGFRDGVVSGNSIVIPRPGDDQYTHDALDNFGPDQDYYSLYSRGVNLGDTQSNGGASNIVIRGNTIFGCMASAIAAAFARGCVIEGNRIVHPSDSHEAPIQLYGASDVDSDWVCHNNVVRGNSIDYTGSNPCVIESGTGWQATHINRVFDNQIGGANYGEFKRKANSGSVTGFRIATNDDTADQQSESEITREGFGSTACLKIYTRINGTRSQVAQLGDENRLLLIGDGTAGSGAVATGMRNSLAWGDAVATGKLYADSMLVLTDASYAEADGHLLSDDYGLIRYDKVDHKFLISTSTQTEGEPPVTTRVWADLLTGGSGVSSLSPGSLTGAVTLKGTTKRITISQSGQDITFTTPQDLDTQASVAFAQLNLTYVQDLYEPAGNDTFDGVLKCFDGIRIYNTAALAPYTDFNNYAMRIDARQGRLEIKGTTGMASLLVQAGWVESVQGYFTESSATNAFQASSGGITVRYLIASRSLSILGDSAVNAGLSNAGTGRIYFDSSLNKFRASQNGGAYVDLVGGGAATPGGSNGNVQYNDSGTLNGMDAFNWDEANQRLELKGKKDQALFVLRGAPVADGSTANLQQWYKNLADVTATAVIDNNCVYYGPAIALRVDDISPASTVEGKYGSREIRFRQTSGDALNAGTIGYRTLGDEAALDIIGAGASTGSRQVRIYDGLVVGNSFSDGYAIKAPMGSVEARAYTSNGGLTSDIVPAAGVGVLYFNSTLNKWRITQGLSGPQDLIGAAGSVPNDISCYTIAMANMDRADRDGVLKLFDSLRIHNTASVSPYVDADNWAVKLSGRTGTMDMRGRLNIGKSTIRAYAQYAGTNSGMIQMHADGDECVVVMDCYSDVGQPAFIARRAHGSASSPSAVNNGDALLVFGGRGWHSGGDFASGNRSAIIFQAAETWGWSNQGARILFGTTPVGSTTRVTRLTVYEDGIVECTGKVGNPALKCNAGYVYSDEGYYANSTSFQALNIPNGGAYARSFFASTYSQVGQSNGAPTATTGASLIAGAVYWDTGTAKLRVYNGSSWSDVAGGSAGVSSLNTLTGTLSIAGTTNQIAVSAAGSSITLSTPQNIDLNAMPSFQKLTLTGTFAGVGEALSIPNGGYISCAGGYFSNSASDEAVKLTDGGITCKKMSIYTGVGSWKTVVNANAQFVGAGVNCPTEGIGCRAVNPNDGSTQWTGIDRTMTLGLVFMRFVGGVLVQAY